MNSPVEHHNAHQQSFVYVNGQQVLISDPTPTGRQILTAARLRPETEHALVLWPDHGPTSVIELDELCPLTQSQAPLRFFAAKADGVKYFILDDSRYAWPGDLTVEALRLVGGVGDSSEVWVEHRGEEPDARVEPGTTIDLDEAGIERFFTREAVKRWDLLVHETLTHWDSPKVIVRDALAAAGMDLTREYKILFKLEGNKREEVGLGDVLDLSRPGIERLWTIPRLIDNGEVAAPARREFGLLAHDHAMLNQRGWRWETINAGHRWLIIDDYPVPEGYAQRTCRLALQIPSQYPSAQIDMFYCYPSLQLTSGGALACCDTQEVIEGVSFQRWSRHRNGADAWSPVHDNVGTHLDLVDESLAREATA